MRISTNLMQLRAVYAMTDQQARVSHTQQQIATGRRVLSAADDPVAAAKMVGLERTVKLIEQYQHNTDMAERRLTLTESILTKVTNILQRVHELAVQGNNAPLSTENRAMIAVEVRHHISEVLDLANTRDADREYLFSGNRGQTTAFSQDSNDTFTYHGDQGERRLQIGNNRYVLINDSGDEVFAGLRAGNGVFQSSAANTNTGTGIISPGLVMDSAAYAANDYRIVFTAPDSYDIFDDTNGVTLATGQAYTSGKNIVFNGIQASISGDPAAGDYFQISPGQRKDIFSVIADLARLLENQPADPAQEARFQTAIQRNLTELDQADTHIVNLRSRIGSRMQSIDNQKELNEANSIQLGKTLSMLQDLDYAEATGRLNLQLTVLEAAQQAFIRVQNLSLFNLLR